MKSRIFLGFLVLLVLFLICFLPSFAYYDFLSPKSNAALEIFKEKFREKEIVCEKEEGVVWTVVIPENDGIEKEEVKEAVYNDETGEIEGIYTFTDIFIKNPHGSTKVVWGSVAKAYPYNVPRIHFIFNFSFNNLFPEENAWVSDDGTLTVAEGPEQEWWGQTIIWSNVILVSQGETIFFTIPSIIGNHY